MLVVGVYDMKGKRTGEVKVDPSVLGDRVRHGLIKQAIVSYLDHRRQDSARTKSRSDVVGSTRKLYRQKGTGNARAGMLRTPVRRGGGRTFAKRGPRRSVDLPKKMRRLARDSAILAKIEAKDVMIVDPLQYNKPATKVFSSMLIALEANRGCLIAMHEQDRNTYLSGRNVPKTDIRVVDDLNAYEVLFRKKLIFSKPAFERLIQRNSG